MSEAKFKVGDYVRFEGDIYRVVGRGRRRNLFWIECLCSKITTRAHQNFLTPADLKSAMECLEERHRIARQICGMEEDGDE
jgi:hypothetical protein